MWQIIEKEIKIEGYSGKSYGVSCGTATINDLSTKKEDVERFVETLNSAGASEIHAKELAEDFLER